MEWTTGPNHVLKIKTPGGLRAKEPLRHRFIPKSLGDTLAIDSNVRDGLEQRAKELGFDSAQAYIRFWAKSEVEGRKIDFGNPTVALSPDADNRYERALLDMAKLRKTGKLEAYSTVEVFMKNLK